MAKAVATSSAIDRYFEICLFLLLTAGFATLAGTGKLDPVSVLLVSGALLARGFFFIAGKNVLIPERWTTAFTLLYVLFFAADYLLLSRGFVAATVHLVLFNVAVKIFSVHRERDNLYLSVLAFLMVLAAAVLTIDSLFLASFCLFLVLAVATFTSMEIRRSQRAASAAGVPGRIPTRFSGALSRTAAVLLAGICISAAVIFFVLPRTSGGYLNNLAAKDVLTSGFSDEVSLGAIGTIQQSNDVVMHVKFSPDSAPPTSADMRWRGLSLSIFNGRRWSNPHHQIRVLPGGGAGSSFNVLGDKSVPRGRIYSYRVLMEPTITNLFFAMPTAWRVSGEYKVLGVSFGGGIQNLDRDRVIGNYTALSVQSDVPTNVQQLEPAKYPPEIELAYLQTPKLDLRIPRLARQITANVKGNYKKAEAIEKYLQDNYGYTLQLADPGDQEPLSFFLFERRQGHCEYFASAMTIMLRSQGIPARVVNGFRGGEWNDVNASYIVRQRDAHSWVEVYIPPYGWATFDPTPADPSAPRNRWARMLLYMDAMRVFWREWIVNFDFSRQATLNHEIGTETRSFSRRVSDWLQRKQDAMQQRLRGAQLALVHAPLPWALRALLVLMVVLLVLAGPRLYRFVRTRGLLRHPSSSPRHAATLWYGKMLRRLARIGYTKKKSQTAEEFAAAIRQPELQAPVRRFSRHYERARFGDSKEDAEELEKVFHEIETTLKK